MVKSLGARRKLINFETIPVACLFVNPHPKVFFPLIFLEKVEGRESDRNMDVKETYLLVASCMRLSRAKG